MHFFSPANVMKLLEVVRPQGVAEDAVVTAMALGRRLGKVPVVVGNGFGFVGNRMLEARTRATERLLIAGALPHEVDAALTGFGWTAGLSLLYIVCLSTLVAFGIWGMLLREYKAGVVAPFSLLVPVTGTVAAHLAFGETFGPLRLLGMALLFAGIVITILPLHRRQAAQA